MCVRVCVCVSLTARSSSRSGCTLTFWQKVKYPRMQARPAALVSKAALEGAAWGPAGLLGAPLGSRRFRSCLIRGFTAPLWLSHSLCARMKDASSSAPSVCTSGCG
jgi:hypothetical protein